mmetsp:Transcript_22402/g.51807  ORF Transcript_22402/g.51807 Transcript_22402/m.51807 type:complete len:242 (+) Transcript_22402:78-803(+)
MRRLQMRHGAWSNPIAGPPINEQRPRFTRLNNSFTGRRHCGGPRMDQQGRAQAGRCDVRAYSGARGRERARAHLVAGARACPSAWVQHRVRRRPPLPKPPSPPLPSPPPHPPRRPPHRRAPRPCRCHRHRRTPWQLLPSPPPPPPRSPRRCRPWIAGRGLTYDPLDGPLRRGASRAQPAHVARPAPDALVQSVPRAATAATPAVSGRGLCRSRYRCRPHPRPCPHRQGRHCRPHHHPSLSR